MSDKLEVQINSEGYVEIKSGKFTKKISIGDFASVINTLVAQEDQVIVDSTFRYPESVHSVTRTTTGYIVNLYYSEREADLQVAGSSPKRVYMPNVMVRLELREVAGNPGAFSIGSIRWFCTDKSRASLGTSWPTGGSSLDHIWTLPMPNIYHHASMCTGGNRLPSVIYADWTVLDMLYNDVLIGSPFNNDLGVQSTQLRHTASSWINTLHEHWKDEESERFPYELLTNY